MNVHQDALQMAAADVMLQEAPTESVLEDMDLATSHMEKDSDEVAEISRNVNDLGEGAESLESYMTKFMAAIPAENWNAKVARQYSLGVAAILSAKGVSIESKHYCASFESSGTTQTHEENHAETTEKSKSLVKRMWEAFKAACAAFFNRCVEMVQSMHRTQAAIEKMVVNLKARLTQVKGKTAAKEHFEGSPAWSSYLQAGEQVYVSSAAVQAAESKVYSLGSGWLSEFVKAAGTIKREVGNATSHTAETFSTGLTTSALGEWPGLVNVELTAREGAVTLMNGKLEVKRSSVALIGNPEVLSIFEIGQTVSELGNMAEAFGEMKTNVTNSIRLVKDIANSIKTDNTAGMNVIGKLVARMAEGPKFAMNQGGAVARDAFIHASKSLNEYR